MFILKMFLTIVGPFLNFILVFFSFFSNIWQPFAYSKEMIRFCEAIMKFSSSFFFLPHAVSNMQQGTQMEPSVKTLRSSFSADFYRH